MLLLIFVLGLFAKLAMVSGDCELGTPTYNYFNWTRTKHLGNYTNNCRACSYFIVYQSPRPWYILLHKSNDRENDFDCFTRRTEMPEENRILTTNVAYSISLQRYITFSANLTNWNSSGYVEATHPLTGTSIRGYFLATDYDNYTISKTCQPDSNEPIYYVGYRSRHPDQATVNDVHRVFQANNIDATQLVEWSANHCQEPESTAVGGSTA